ncbi:MAG: helix-turn-helix domain-containing protein [Candidatus Eisenbacteria bacterium]
MESVGELLRSERETQEKSIDDVAKATKMSASIIEAIESDRFSVLPAPVYVKGHLRTYARFLGLDEEDVVDKYMRFTQQQEPDELDEWDAVEIELQEQRRETGKRWVWMVVGAVAVVVVILLVVKWVNRPPAPTGGGTEEAPLVTQPVSEAAWVDTMIEVHGLELMAVARERVYITVSVDGERVSDLTLDEGDRRRWEGVEEFTLFVGTGEALELYLNGEYLGVAGAGRGPVDNLVVTEGGMSR